MTENLRDEVEVRDQSTLQNDGDVGCVEQLYGVGAVLATVTGTLDRQVDSKSLHHSRDTNSPTQQQLCMLYLEVYDNSKH